MEDKLTSSPQEQKPVTSWRKSTRVGDDEETIEVEKISNGFLVTKSKNWRDKDKGYQSSNEKIFSKTNPLEGDSKAGEKKNDIKDLYKSMFGEGTPLT